MGFPLEKAGVPLRSDSKDGDIHTIPQLSGYLVAQTVESAFNAGDLGLIPDSWGREGLPTPIILPRELHRLQYMG